MREALPILYPQLPIYRDNIATKLASTSANVLPDSESTSIPKNPRTDRPVGYAFVDPSTPSEAERAIAELSGKEILDRKVSVQLARKPEPNTEKGEGAASGGEGVSGGEGGRRRASGRGRGRGRGRGGRANRNVSLHLCDCMLISLMPFETGPW